MGIVLEDCGKIGRGGLDRFCRDMMVILRMRYVKGLKRGFGNNVWGEIGGDSGCTTWELVRKFWTIFEAVLERFEKGVNEICRKI